MGVMGDWGGGGDDVLHSLRAWSRGDLFAEVDCAGLVHGPKVTAVHCPSIDLIFICLARIEALCL